jgi:hypothetical protein
LCLVGVCVCVWLMVVVLGLFFRSLAKARSIRKSNASKTIRADVIDASGTRPKCYKIAVLYVRVRTDFCPSTHAVWIYYCMRVASLPSPFQLSPHLGVSDVQIRCRSVRFTGQSIIRRLAPLSFQPLHALAAPSLLLLTPHTNTTTAHTNTNLCSRTRLTKKATKL